MSGSTHLLARVVARSIGKPPDPIIPNSAVHEPPSIGAVVDAARVAQLLDFQVAGRAGIGSGWGRAEQSRSRQEDSEQSALHAVTSSGRSS